MICLGMHSNEMLRFMVQAFQDPRYVEAPIHDQIFFFNNLLATSV
jgi:hypothetical protein